MQNVKINFVKNLFEDAEVIEPAGWRNLKLPPGSATWSMAAEDHSRKSSLLFTCPCGCGIISAVNVLSPEQKPFWQLSGGGSTPTLQPSILRTEGCGWHGYLVEGVFTPC